MSAISMQSAVRQELDPQGTIFDNIATSMDPSRLSQRIRRLPLPRVDRSVASRFPVLTVLTVPSHMLPSSLSRPNRSSMNANSLPSTHLALLRVSILLRILTPVRVLLRIFIVPRKNRCNHHLPKVCPSEDAARRRVHEVMCLSPLPPAPRLCPNSLGPSSLGLVC